MKQKLFALTFLLLSTSIFCEATKTVNLITSSCTNNLGSATLNGFWEDDAHTCNLNNTTTTNGAQCVTQYPASDRYVVVNRPAIAVTLSLTICRGLQAIRVEIQ